MYDLIIFDCDGTLVDSEKLYSQITADLLNDAGYDEYTPELCSTLFTGQSWITIRTWLEEKHQAPMPADIVERYKNLARERMDQEITPVPHAHEILTEIRQANSHKICVASNGERSNVLRSLRIANLHDHFIEEHVFTKIEVERPKPAPDLFLHVADKMQACPTKTLVIEDSDAGVVAAVAANMDVIGFTGTSHDPKGHKKALKEAGAHAVIDSLIHISEALKHGKGWKND